MQLHYKLKIKFMIFYPSLERVHEDIQLIAIVQPWLPSRMFLLIKGSSVADTTLPLKDNYKCQNSRQDIAFNVHNRSHSHSFHITLLGHIYMTYRKEVCRGPSNLNQLDSPLVRATYSWLWGHEFEIRRERIEPESVNFYPRNRAQESISPGSISIPGHLTRFTDSDSACELTKRVCWSAEVCPVPRIFASCIERAHKSRNKKSPAPFPSPSPHPHTPQNVFVPFSNTLWTLWLQSCSNFLPSHIFCSYCHKYLQVQRRRVEWAGPDCCTNTFLHCYCVCLWNPVTGKVSEDEYVRWSVAESGDWNFVLLPARPRQNFLGRSSQKGQKAYVAASAGKKRPLVSSLEICSLLLRLLCIKNLKKVKTLIFEDFSTRDWASSKFYPLH